MIASSAAGRYRPASVVYIFKRAVNAGQIAGIAAKSIALRQLFS